MLYSPHLFGNEVFLLCPPKPSPTPRFWIWPTSPLWSPSWPSAPGSPCPLGRCLLPCRPLRSLPLWGCWGAAGAPWPWWSICCWGQWVCLFFRGLTAVCPRSWVPLAGIWWAFWISALLYWAITARLGTGRKVLLPTMILALVVCYAFGTFWFLQVYTGGGEKGTLWGPWPVRVSLHPADLIKIALALILTRPGGQAHCPLILSARS